MKRKRDLLYDVFGRKNLVVSDSGVLPPPRKPERRSPREWRVSRELVVVLGVIVVVFVGTSYYLGTLGGKSATTGAGLSVKGRTARPEAALKPDEVAPPSDTAPFWTVRVFTDRWSVKEGPSKAEAGVLKVCDLLERQGFKDVLPVRDREARQIVVYVGRTENPATLQPVRDRLQKLSFGESRPFADAYIYKVDFPIH
jgi:hypothetical protein